MTLDEVRQLYSLIGSFGVGALVAAAIGYLIVRNYLSSYLSEKAKNLATREDIATITDEIEKVRSQYTTLIEELKARHQLRMAAVDRRLQAHQEAFTNWRELLAAMHTDEVGKTVVQCQTWWEQNCIYLEPKVRQAFVESYSAAHMHHALMQRGADAKVIMENEDRVIKFPNILFEAIQLPALSELEVEAIQKA